MSEFYAAATAIVENSDGEILMVQEGKEHIKGKWDFPGGGWENNESTIECVEREVLEETGYQIKAEKLIGIWKTESLRDGTETLIFAFEAEINSKKFDEPKNQEEILDAKFFTQEEIQELELREQQKHEILESYLNEESKPLSVLKNELNLLQ